MGFNKWTSLRQAWHVRNEGVWSGTVTAYIAVREKIILPLLALSTGICNAELAGWLVYIVEYQDHLTCDEAYDRFGLLNCRRDAFLKAS